MSPLPLKQEVEKLGSKRGVVLQSIKDVLQVGRHAYAHDPLSLSPGHYD
jgi:hypothetical protein